MSLTRNCPLRLLVASALLVVMVASIIGWAAVSAQPSQRAGA